MVSSRGTPESRYPRCFPVRRCAAFCSTTRPDCTLKDLSEIRFQLLREDIFHLHGYFASTLAARLGAFRVMLANLFQKYGLSCDKTKNILQRDGERKREGEKQQWQSKRELYQCLRISVGTIQDSMYRFGIESTSDIGSVADFYAVLRF